ncbi:adhesin [Streptomyces sp. Ru87]|nr:adhesin [Streptomyces sp. Ru87]
MPGWDGGNANAAYLDKTLRHEPVELALGEGVSGRAVFFLWLRAAAVASVVWWGAMIFALLSYAASEDDSDPYGSSGFGQSSSGSDFADVFAGGWAVFGFLASAAVFWLILLATRCTEPIAEWRVLLTDRMDSAPAVYSQIAGTLAGRKSPLRVDTHRIRMNDVGTVSSRLRLTEGPYAVYVSVFPYGTSLYLGWTMWRSRRGAKLIGQYIADLFRGMAGQHSAELEVMRSERPRAMREAVHLACREGLFVAVENRAVPDDYGFPQGLPPIVDASELSGSQGPAEHPAAAPSYDTAAWQVPPQPPHLPPQQTGPGVHPPQQTGPGAFPPPSPDHRPPGHDGR